MNKISVNICTHPNCYVEGATLLKQLDAMMCARLKNKIALAGTDCTGHCSECGVSQAPCARIDGMLIPQAQPGAVLNAIRKVLA